MGKYFHPIFLLRIFSEYMTEVFSILHYCSAVLRKGSHLFKMLVLYRISGFQAKAFPSPT